MNGVFEKNKNLFLILITLLTTSSLSAQGWERIYWGGGIIPPQTNLNQAWADHVFIQDDGTYMFAGYINYETKFVWTDESGYVNNLSDTPVKGSSLIKTVDGNYFNAFNTDNVHLVKN